MANSYLKIHRSELDPDTKLAIALIESVFEDLKSNEPERVAEGLGWLAEDGVSIIDRMGTEFKGADMLDAIFRQFDPSSLLEINDSICRVVREYTLHATTTARLFQQVLELVRKDFVVCTTA